MAYFVEIAIVVAGELPIGLGRDDHCLAGGSQRLDDPLLDLKSIVLELQRSAIPEHADTRPAFDNPTIALQGAAVALQKHALHLKEMVDPVRSVLRPERFYQAGNVALADERFEIAAGYFRRALELRAEYPEAHRGLGDALRKQGAHEDAIKHYRQAVETQASLAHALETQGKLAEAAKGYRTAGVDLMEQGRYDEAANTFREAIRLDRRNAEAHSHLGDALQRKHEYGAAEAALRTAIDLDPTYSHAYTVLARLLIHLNRHDEALSLLSTCAAIIQDHIEFGDAVKVPAYRIKHDREQMELLRQRGLLDKKWEIYADYLNTLWHDRQTRADSGAPVAIVGADVHKIAPSYNRFVYLPKGRAVDVRPQEGSGAAPHRSFAAYRSRSPAAHTAGPSAAGERSAWRLWHPAAPARECRVQHHPDPRRARGSAAPLGCE